MKKGWKIVLFAGLGLLLLFILSIGFTQTRIFRNWLREYILATIQQNTNATLYLGDFAGSLFTGLRIDGVSLTLDGQELFTADLVELRYNPLKLFQKRIGLGKCVLTQPKLTLRRSQDGKWNLQHLLKEREDTARPPTAFPWKLELKSFEVLDGEFILVDPTTGDVETESIADAGRDPYGHIVIRNVDAQLYASIFPEKLYVTIDRLSLESPSLGMRLEKMSADLQFTPEKIQLKNLVLVTAGTTITANAEFDSVGFGRAFTAETVRHQRVRLELDAPRISLKEIENFLPGPISLDGVVSLRVVLSGTFGNLRLQQFDLKSAESQLKVTGLLEEVLDSEKRTFDVSVDFSSVDVSRLQTYVTSLGLSRLEYLRGTDIAGYFKGGPKNFHATVKADLKERGRFEAVGHIDLRGTIPEYQVKFSTSNLDLGPLLAKGERFSRLNSSGEISGKGLMVKDLEGNAALTVDSSNFSNLQVGKSLLSFTAADQRLDGNVSLRFDGASVQIRGTMDVRDEVVPSYDLAGEFSALDLSKLFPGKDYRSDLNGSFTLSGSGKDFDHASGDLELNFGASSFRGRSFEGPAIELAVDQRQDKLKTIVLESPLLDARVEGNFRLKPFFSLVKYQVGNVLRSLRERLPLIDTTRAMPVASKTATRPNASTTGDSLTPEYFDFNYDIAVKNLTPLAVFLGEEDFNGRANLKGFVVGDADDLLLGGALSVDNFVYRGKDTRVLITQANVNLEVDHLKQQNVLDELKTKIDAKASQCFLNGLRVTNLAASVDYRGGKGYFDVRGLIDSTLNVETNGIIEVSPSGYHWKLDNLAFDYRGSYWDNRDPLVVTIDSMGLMLQNVELRQQMGRVQLSGGIRPSRELDLRVKVQDYQLSDLHHFLPGENQKKLSGIASVEAVFSGPVQNPDFSIQAKAENVKYGTVAFGNFQADLSYAEQITRVGLELRSTSSQGKPPELLVRGTIPMDLTFGSVKDRFREGGIDLQVQANAFHLHLLDPFIPVFDEIEGQLFADLQLGGTTKKPLWWGSMRIEDGQFVFGPNGLRYYVSGSFEPKEEKFLISKLVLRNEPKDNESKGLTVNGELTVKPFYIESFDLSAKGQLMILRETVRKSQLGPYGNVLVASGPNGLRYNGTLERSNLTGSVLVKMMSIAFPPVALQASNLPTQSYSYVVIDDTSRPAVLAIRSDSPTEDFYPPEEGKQKTDLRNQENTFEKLLAGMRADVAIETDGPAQLRMIFNYSTGEELFSELQGRLFLIKDEFGTRFIGDVDVGQRSYYYFYKRFDATGKLRFAGPLTNPEMDITATYKGFRLQPPTDTLAISTREDQQEVVVTLKLTGTRLVPKLSVEMTVGGTEWSGDVQSDAIAFIVSGKFRDDLTTPERNQIATGLGTSVTSMILTGAASSLLSGVLTDFLRRELGGFVRQAELIYPGGSVYESADLRVTGEIGQTIIRIGGRVFTDIGNANVSVQMPIGRIIRARALEDLIIELDRKVEGSSYATDEKKLTNGVRVYYRITF